MKIIQKKVTHKDIDWHHIDINQPIHKTMVQTGLSEWYVRQQRNRLGVLKKKKINWRNVDLLQPTEKLINELGATEKQISDARRIRGLNYKKTYKFPVIHKSTRTLMEKTPVVKKKRLARFFFSLSQLFS